MVQYLVLIYLLMVVQAYNVTKTTTQFRNEHAEADNSADLLYRTGGDLAQSTTSYQNLGDTTGSDLMTKPVQDFYIYLIHLQQLM
jgi:hypothetical protein